jgi:hypothetical protein
MNNSFCKHVVACAFIFIKHTFFRKGRTTKSPEYSINTTFGANNYSRYHPYSAAQSDPQQASNKAQAFNAAAASDSNTRKGHRTGNSGMSYTQKDKHRFSPTTGSLYV